MKWDRETLKEMPTLVEGKCCNLKVETAALRVWVCRAGGGVTVEQYQPMRGRWEAVAGGCNNVA